MSAGTTCVAKDNYTVLQSDSTDLSQIDNRCVTLGENTDVCILEGQWDVFSNCLNGVCYDDLKSYCGENEGIYFNDTFNEDGVGLVREPSCALLQPYSSVDKCQPTSNGTFSQNCSPFTESECPGYLYNDDQSCLIDGTWTVVTNVIDTEECYDGKAFEKNCLLNGTWTLVTSSNATEMSAGCLRNYGVRYDNGHGCALQGVWSSVLCSVEPCELDERVCNSYEGFAIAEGCVLPDRWVVLSEMAPDGIVEDNGGKWEQCKRVEGILFDNFLSCAVPCSCRKYNPTVWKVMLILLAVLAAIILILKYTSSLYFMIRRRWCSQKVEIVE